MTCIQRGYAQAMKLIRVMFQSDASGACDIWAMHLVVKPTILSDILELGKHLGPIMSRAKHFRPAYVSEM